MKNKTFALYKGNQIYKYGEVKDVEINLRNNTVKVNQVEIGYSSRTKLFDDWCLLNVGEKQ